MEDISQTGDFSVEITLIIGRRSDQQGSMLEPEGKEDDEKKSGGESELGTTGRAYVKTKRSINSFHYFASRHHSSVAPNKYPFSPRNPKGINKHREES